MSHFLRFLKCEMEIIEQLTLPDFISVFALFFFFSSCLKRENYNKKDSSSFINLHVASCVVAVDAEWGKIAAESGVWLPKKKILITNTIVLQNEKANAAFSPRTCPCSAVLKHTHPHGMLITHSHTRRFPWSWVCEDELCVHPVSVGVCKCAISQHTLHQNNSNASILAAVQYESIVTVFGSMSGIKM